MRVLFWAMILLIAAWTDFRIMVTLKPKPPNPKPMLLSLIRGCLCKRHMAVCSGGVLAGFFWKHVIVAAVVEERDFVPKQNQTIFCSHPDHRLGPLPSRRLAVGGGVSIKIAIPMYCSLQFIFHLILLCGIFMFKKLR